MLRHHGENAEVSKAKRDKLENSMLTLINV